MNLKFWKKKDLPSKSVQKAHSPVNTLTSVNYKGGVASWIDLQNDLNLLKCYKSNPVLPTIIGIDADAWANAKFYVKSLKDGEEIPLNEYTADGGKLKDLINNPNPLQTTAEWLRQLRTMFLVFGNNYNYASVPVGFEKNFDYKDISVINNLHAYCVTPQLSGKWLSATTKDEIITHYDFSNINGSVLPLPTNQVMHYKNTNITLDSNFTEGVSDLVALRDPISNIALAYESRNVAIKNRGANGIISPDSTEEGTGSTIPYKEHEIKEIQDAYKNYGGLDGQYNLLISPQPLKYTKISMSIKELMLFEEVESNAMAIANAIGVPELLAKYYLKGGTFENLNASERRLYDSSVIPKFNAFMESLNSFLGLKDYGIQLIGRFDHLKVLQKDQKLEAETMKLKVEAAETAFRSGAITYNVYLAMIDQPNDAVIGHKKITDLKPEQLTMISSFSTSQKGFGNSQEETEEDETGDN